MLATQDFSHKTKVVSCTYLDLNGHHGHLVSIADLNITREWLVWTAKQISDLKLKLTHFAQKEILLREKQKQLFEIKGSMKSLWDI